MLSPPPPRCSFSWGSVTLSPVSLLLLGTVLCLCIACILFNWLAALLLPLALLVPLGALRMLYWRWLRLAPQPIDETMVRVFVGGFWAAGLAMLAEIPLVYLGAALTVGFSPEVAAEAAGGASGDPDAELTKDLAHTPAYYAFLLWMSFVAVAASEEAIKAMVVRCSCLPADAALCVQRRDFIPRRQAHNTMALCIAAALGFSLSENLVYLMMALVAAGFQGGDAALAGALVVVLRSFFSMPMHASCAALTGLRLVMRDTQRHRREALAARLSVAAVIRARGGGAGVAAGGGGAAAGSRAQSEAIVVLTDGEGRHQVLPSAAAAAAGGGEAAYANVEDMETPSGIAVWGWARVLAPAWALHGAFDLALLLLQGDLPGDNPLAEAALGGLVATLFIAAAVVLVNRQLASAWEDLSQGALPEGGITCATAASAGVGCCWRAPPAQYDSVLTAGAYEAQELDAQEQGAQAQSQAPVMSPVWGREDASAQPYAPTLAVWPTGAGEPMGADRASGASGSAAV